MEENEITTMVEEGEDILDGLESMLGDDGNEVTEDILKDVTELITTIIIAEEMAKHRVAPVFQQAGKARADKVKRIGRAEGMIRMREEMTCKVNGLYNIRSDRYITNTLE